MHWADNRQYPKNNALDTLLRESGRNLHFVWFESKDDPFAVLAHRLIKLGESPPEELVNWTSNTLSPTSLKFTTISAIYESIQTILVDERLSQKRRPSDAKLDYYYEQVKVV